MILLVVALLSTLASTPGLAETIYLKDGTVLHGTIREQGLISVTIESSVGRMVIEKSRIASIDYEDNPRLTRNEGSLVVRELRMSRLESREQFDMWGLITTVTITLVGDVALGGTFYPGSAIPVIGPFVTAFNLNENDYGLHKEQMDRDRLLFVVSGVVQSLFAIDWSITALKKHELGQEVTLHVIPTRSGLAVRATF